MDNIFFPPETRQQVPERSERAGDRYETIPGNQKLRNSDAAWMNRRWTGDTQLLGRQPWSHSRWVRAEGACCTFAQRRNCNGKLLPNQQKQSFRWLQLLHWGQIWTGGEKHFSWNVFDLDTEKQASIWFWARRRASFFPLVICGASVICEVLQQAPPTSIFPLNT